MRAVIFDFDGVLVDSLRINFEAKKALFAGFGVQLSEREFIDIWVCPQSRGKEGIPYYLKLKGLKASVEELRAMQKPIYEKLFKEKAKPMPGVLALIRRLRKRGVPLAVVSSNYRYNIELALRKFGMLEDFKVIISCEDCRRIKPDPEPYLRAVEKLGCAPQEVIVVEDAEKGVESAKAAGCKCIAIPNHYTAHGDFSKADAVVKKFSDINSKLLAKF